MANKLITFTIVQAFIFQMAYSQVIGRYGGCGCPNIFQEQFISSYPSYIPGPSQVIYDQPTTIIQDSTVANNLANALQLLVVSNLLSNTLPLEQNLPVLPANVAPLELLSGYAGAPVALAPSCNAPLQYAPNVFNSCGCGACNSCGLSGLGPYNFVY
ncbi:hypothetical protein O0L34_g13280 [Tuta absoluta]|nr:hypothetical protein O0L34_g13280 [Tuta absoluta]